MIIQNLDFLKNFSGLLIFFATFQEPGTLWQEEQSCQQAVNGEDQRHHGHIPPVFGRRQEEIEGNTYFAQGKPHKN
jgi:hypothetical protein